MNRNHNQILLTYACHNTHGRTKRPFSSFHHDVRSRFCHMPPSPNLIHIVYGQLQLVIVMVAIRSCSSGRRRTDNNLKHAACLVAGRIVGRVHDPMAADAEKAAR